jgi:hypothetical protein
MFHSDGVPEPRGGTVCNLTKLVVAFATECRMVIKPTGFLGSHPCGESESRAT